MRSVALDRLAGLLLLCSGLVACTEAVPQRYDSEFLAMGTQVQLSLWASSPTQAATISRQLEQQLLQQGTDWYPWTQNPQGELKQLNAALVRGNSFTVSDSLAGLLQQALQLHQASEGYFDPAVAPMTVAWGFADSQAAALTALPTAERLTVWRQSRPTLADLQLRDYRVSSTRRDLQIDLGAIAKGYALDLAMQKLRQAGIAQASLNLGGQIILMGQSLPVSATQVAVREPRSLQALGSLQLHGGESISTSGDYERSTTVQGQRIHHLLDPHTGAPITHTQAVTVIASSATLADAASTALMAGGPEHWREIAARMNIREVLRIDATGKIEVTAALYARLQWNPKAIAAHSIQQTIIYSTEQ
ncbi:MAG: FAD:protein FMN transferase [Steroidobacteraceae bacterium]